MSNVSLSQHEGTSVLSIHGAFVFDINRDFRQAYRAIDPGTSVLVDLSRTSYIDSAGLGMLIKLREHIGGGQPLVTLRGANDTVHTILTVANFGRLFIIEDGS